MPIKLRKEKPGSTPVKSDHCKFPPLVSLIVPNFNYARFLPDCLESLLLQSYKNLEIISKLKIGDAFLQV